MTSEHVRKPKLISKKKSLKHQEAQEKAQIATVHKTTAMYNGPIPPPAMLEKFDEILPGLANRIVTMAEKEQLARHNKDKTALWLAAGISYFFILAALIAAIFSPIGMILGLGALAPLIAKFLKK